MLASLTLAPLKPKLLIGGIVRAIRSSADGAASTENKYTPAAIGVKEVVMQAVAAVSAIEPPYDVAT